MRFLRSVTRERGMVLPLALGILSVLSVSTVVVVDYSSSNARTASYSKDNAVAHSLAQAGLNNALAVLNEPNNNALNSALLPNSEGTASSANYQGGTAKWWGVLTGNVWKLYGLGIVKNPTGPTAPSIRRQLTASVTVTTSLTQPLNNQAWNYLFSVKTGDPDNCDQHFNNNAVVKAPMYVMGNLCVDNNASIQKAGTPPTPEPMVNLVVKGKVTLGNGSYIGTSGAKINQAFIVGGCNNNIPCKWNGGGDSVWANTVSTTAPDITPPTADYDYWYTNASPGPYFPCTTVSGTPPVFENETTGKQRNTSAGTINLMPAASYTCRTSSGELSWNATTKVLTVSGVIFVDGNVSVSNGSVTQYNGQASFYVNGTLTFTVDTKLCGGISGSNCDFAAWNPNTEMLIFTVYGTAGGATDYGATFSNNAMFQGGVYATHSVLIDNNASTEGPMVANDIELRNNMTAKPFPVITTVPLGTPGNPNVHAEPQPPSSFSG